MDLQKFFASIRARPFGGSLTVDQVRGTEAILAAWDRHGDGDLRKLATILANVYHETARRMRGIKETVMPHHKDADPSDATVIARLDAAWAAGQLTGVSSPYWREGWFGRGPIQLTHRDNYAKLGRRLSVDLVSNPNLAMDLRIGAEIAVVGMMEGLFRSRRVGTSWEPAKLADYFDGSKADWNGSRAIVNGDVARNGPGIASSALAFHAALLAAGADKTERVGPKPPAIPEPVKRGLWGALAAAGAAVAGWLAALPLPALILGALGIAFLIILAMHRWSR